MTDLLTPNGVVLHLTALSRDLDATVQSLEVADRSAVNSRETFTMAYAKAFLTAQGAMDVRRYQATVDTHAERLAAEADEQVVRGLRRQIESLRIRIDVGRSAGTALRAELSLAGAS